MLILVLCQQWTYLCWLANYTCILITDCSSAMLTPENHTDLIVTCFTDSGDSYSEDWKTEDSGDWRQHKRKMRKQGGDSSSSDLCHLCNPVDGMAMLASQHCGSDFNLSSSHFSHSSIPLQFMQLMSFLSTSRLGRSMLFELLCCIEPEGNWQQKATLTPEGSCDIFMRSAVTVVLVVTGIFNFWFKLHSWTKQMDNET